MYIPLKLNLQLTDFEAPSPRELKHLVTLFVPGRPRPKQRLRHVLAGMWSKYKPHPMLQQLKAFLGALQFCFASPEMPADELKERARGQLPCLMAIENLPEGRPKVIGFTPKDTEDFENKIAQTARKLFTEPPSANRIAVYFKFIYKMRNWADVDNLEKSILDGLEKGRVFKNDRQVEVHLSFREYVKDTKLEGSLVKVYEVRDPVERERNE